MSTKAKKKVKPQKFYAIVYKTPNGRFHAIYLDYDNIGFHTSVINTFNTYGERLKMLYSRAIRLCHTDSYANSGGDINLNKAYRHGKVFITRLGTKNCPIRIPNMPTSYNAHGESIDRVTFQRRDV